MKKILLLIVLVLAIVFVGKYVYDKQSDIGAVTLEGEANSANVSVSVNQTLTAQGNSLRYTAPIKIVNSTTIASTSFTFLNMPVLYKKNNKTGLYSALSSVRPVGNIVDESGVVYPLTGPVYVIGVGSVKRFTVTAVYSNLPEGVYKVALGESKTDSSGYSINGGKLKPLPTTQTNSVTVSASATSTPAHLTFASSSLSIVRNNAQGTPTGLEGFFNISMTVGANALVKMNTAAEIEIINVGMGAVATSFRTVLGGTVTERYNAGASYPLQFNFAVPALNLSPGVYKAVLRKVVVTDVNGVTTDLPLNQSIYVTNTVTY